MCRLKGFARFLQVAFLCGITFSLTSSQKCDERNCKLPSCRCPAVHVPGGLEPSDIPQMVLITFDDAVNWENWDYYMQLFPKDGSRRNPNGCPISATLFVSHNFTDYCMVQKLHARGMEIADHSITHKLPREWWSVSTKEELQYEILNQRDNLADYGHIPYEDIRGWRSPFLQPNGDNQFDILYKNNFTYDATMTYPFPRNLYSPVLWPFTMDFPWSIACNIDPCPQNTYPDFWVVPVVTLMDYREHLPCSYVDFCTNKPRNQDETFEFLWKNFMRNYRTNRAPLYINLHSVWFDENNYNLESMDQFIQRLVAMDDVYIVNVYDAIKWTKNPQNLQSVKNFEDWQCTWTEDKEDKQFCEFTFRPRTTPRPKPTTTTSSLTEKTTKTKHPKPPTDTKGHENDVTPNGFIPWFRRTTSSAPRCSSAIGLLIMIFVIYIL